MAKCENCNTSYDYEKYYGICPRCGAYNKENKGEEAPPGQDGQMIPMPSAENQGGNRPKRVYEFKDAGIPVQNRPMNKKKNSGGAIALFVCLILGIVLTIAVPIGYFLIGAVQMTSRAVVKSNKIISELPDPEVSYGSELGERIPQDADMVMAAAGENIKLGMEESLTIQVKEAFVLVPPGLMEEFPKDERLVAISVDFNGTGGGYHSYDPFQIVYAGYGDGIFKESMSPYSLEEYTNILAGRNVLEAYSMVNSEGSGEFLIFVPQDVEEIQLYLESRNEDTNEVLEVYQIPLTIKSGEGA